MTAKVDMLLSELPKTGRCSRFVTRLEHIPHSLFLPPRNKINFSEDSAAFPRLITDLVCICLPEKPRSDARRLLLLSSPRHNVPIKPDKLARLILLGCLVNLPGLELAFFVSHSLLSTLLAPGIEVM